MYATLSKESLDQPVFISCTVWKQLYQLHFAWYTVRRKCVNKLDFVCYTVRRECYNQLSFSCCILLTCFYVIHCQLAFVRYTIRRECLNQYAFVYYTVNKESQILPVLSVTQFENISISLFAKLSKNNISFSLFYVIHFQQRMPQ